ncbi:MAG: hypothetical protein IJY67_07780 [Paludibacteraceae bacterium]|nr:hypothetical protein [Paludibacteraceae bacterium]
MDYNKLDASFLYYKDKILSMRVSMMEGGIIYIAKPILVLAILNCIDRNLIVENKIFYNKELKETYKCFYQIHKKYIQDVTPIWKPFFHLKNDNFYHLVSDKSFDIKTPSNKFIIENIKYAKFDDELWILLQNSGYREKLKEIIFNFYIK